MRMAVSLEDGLGLSGDRCMPDTPTVTIVRSALREHPSTGAGQVARWLAI